MGRYYEPHFIDLRKAAYIGCQDQMTCMNGVEGTGEDGDFLFLHDFPFLVVIISGFQQQPSSGAKITKKPMYLRRYTDLFNLFAGELC
jgi:hypothetical protein